MATADRTTKLDDDLTVSAIGFGAGALTSAYGDVDDAESLATLNRCLDLDVTFIDTANVYGGGDNERLIAKLLADRRDEVTLATKFGIASKRDALDTMGTVLEQVGDDTSGRLSSKEPQLSSWLSSNARES